MELGTGVVPEIRAPGVIIEGVFLLPRATEIFQA